MRMRERERAKTSMGLPVEKLMHQIERMRDQERENGGLGDKWWREKRVDKGMDRYECVV